MTDFRSFASSFLVEDEDDFTDSILKDRKCSLPISLEPYRASTSRKSTVSPADELSTLYRSMQPPRDSIQLRSFLSLDLADSQSLTEASLRRKASSKHLRTVPDIRTSFWEPAQSPHLLSDESDEPPSSAFADLLSFSFGLDSPQPTLHDFASVSPLTPIPPPSPSRSAGRRSRDLHRPIPSPKPAPSAFLPPVPPKTNPHARPLPTPPSRSPVSPSPAPSSFPIRGHQPQPSFASSIARSEAPSSFAPSTSSSNVSFGDAFSPSSSVRSSEAIMTSMWNQLRRSMSITSGQRVANRSDALACLEGRSSSPDRIPRSRSNFMCMSDDEDEDDEEECEAFDDISPLPVWNDEDQQESDSLDFHDALVYRPTKPAASRAPSAAHPRPSAAFTRTLPSRSQTHIVFSKPPPTASIPASCHPLTHRSSISTTSSKSSRKRRSTMESSWFPIPASFVNFMDLADDAADLTSNFAASFRSFVDIGGVS
ncbi:hypothetical protein JAAARDRAFT_63043 [Jaapia argillacea MUCL 33604]|uniref:Uncharacterized protein n=1 Tax=Jaapia argillacea MUCL 33604 TaxID=933084 RepID=A0A067P7K4_9AGAM|nr:hypothetical protein JAAARDRAFT_63043 [Jaapia argillacea MUCL 33604]